MDLGLTGRTAVVTGASEGIGRAIAIGLAAEGVHLGSARALARTARARSPTEIEAAGGPGDVLVLPTDVRDQAAVDAAARAVGERFGRVDILVNDAGNRMRPGRQIAWSDEEWLLDIDTKLVGMLRVTRAFEPLLPSDGAGRIVNVSGVAGSIVWETALTHGINNAAMNHATRYLASDLAARRITVNAVIPGLIATDWRRAWARESGRASGHERGSLRRAGLPRQGHPAGPLGGARGGRRRRRVPRVRAGRATSPARASSSMAA